MPKKVKLIFSALVLLVAVLSAWFLSSVGGKVTPWLALFLGLFSVGSFWIFPEVSSKKGG